MRLSDYFKKADILLLLLFLLVGAGALFASKGLSSGAGMVQISVDGKLYGEYSLFEDRQISVDSEYGHNVVEIKDGVVSMIESNCPGQDCRHFAPVSKPGQTIMCMPHRLIVAISGKAEFDVMSY